MTTSNSRRPFTVAVEGNIGSGKTTFLNYFNQHENICVLAEPVELWRNCNGHNLLLTMLQHHCLRNPVSDIVLSRKWNEIRLFLMSQLSVIDEHFKWMTNNEDTKVDLI
ncbi:hypothetical protein NQ318_002512, partial [Aromia moschata]